jgi:Apg6 BARA domain
MDENVRSSASKRRQSIQAENVLLHQQLDAVRRKRQLVQLQASLQDTYMTELKDRLNVLVNTRNENLISYQSASSACSNAQILLCQYQNMNATYDCFHISFDGPFATINGLRLGAEASPPVVDSEFVSLSRSTSTQQGESRRFLYFSNAEQHTFRTPSSSRIKVPWKEINGALGQVALLISTMEKKPNTGVKLRCEIKPAGCTSKIGVRHGLASTTTLYNLYYVDEAFQFFGKRNFNTALQHLVQCVSDIADVVRKRDRTIILPYPIEQKKVSGRNAIVEFLVGGVTIAHGIDDIEWTRAMKYLLTDIKHIMIYKPFSFSV